MTLARDFFSYDVSDDDDRARIAALLSSVGVRRQRSVFECQLADGVRDDLVSALRRLMNPAVDRLLVVRECGDCRTRRIESGPTERRLDERYWVV